MRNLQSRRERMKRPILNLLRNVAPLVAAISISACAPFIKPKSVQPKPRAKPIPVKIVKKKPTPTEELIKALDDPDQHMQKFALESLIMGGKDTVPGLVRAFEQNSGFPMFHPVAFALIKIGMPALPAVARTMGTGKHYSTRFLSACIIGKIALANKGDPRIKIVVPALIGRLYDDFLIVRIAAINILGLLQDDRALPHLQRIAEATDDKVVERIARRAIKRISAK